MRFLPSLVACSLLALGASSLRAAPEAIVAEPNPVLAGQAVTFRWYFTGDKVVVSGGRFGQGAAVTGRTTLTDTPRKTTRYNFDVWYRAAPPANGTAPAAGKPLHAHYSLVVQVLPQPALSAYRDTGGWQIRYLKSWQCDRVALPDPVNNGLLYFQPEDDSVERLAVSILPAQDMTPADLMKKVQTSLPASYDKVEVLTQVETTCGTVPAIWTVFAGMDQTHPGTRTQSMVLAFVRDGRAFVVSARTTASQFRMRQAVLEKMVRSFAFTDKKAAVAPH